MWKPYAREVCGRTYSTQPWSNTEVERLRQIIEFHWKLAALNVCSFSRCKNQRHANRLHQKWSVPLQNACLPLLSCLKRILGLLKHRDFVMKDDDREHSYLLDFGKSEKWISISGPESESVITHLRPMQALAPVEKGRNASLL